VLDRRLLQEDPGRLERAVARRGDSAAHVDPEALRELAAHRLAAIRRFEERRTEQNRRSKALRALPKGSDEFKEAVTALRALSAEVKEAEAARREAEAALDEALLLVPNLPLDEVPDGADEADNRVVRSAGETAVPPWIVPHFELGVRRGLLDFERASNLSGARFVVLKGGAARLERALLQLMLDLHADEHGYLEVMTPFLVGREAMTGTGQLPKFEDDAFQTASPELFLVPTGEVPMVNLHGKEVLDEADLPIRYAGYTPCFRREAGSYGQDTRGLIRLHQFNKVELVWFSKPEDSPAALEALAGHAEEVLRRLELPYRVVELCTGDLGFAAARCYDLEVWFPAQGRYREISSCSDCGDFQARRASIRYRPAGGGKPRLVHTLNGSGVALGRCLAALLENHQREDGTVRVPEALRPYLGGLDVIE